MGFREDLLNSIDNKGFEVKDKNNNIIAYLVMINESDLDDTFLLEKMTLWRKQYINCFLSFFEPSVKRTHDWIKFSLLKNESRVLFKILTADSKLVGHIGAIYNKDFIEYDYYIKGEKVDIKDFAIIIAKRFLFWICNTTSVDKILGNVRSDNLPTIDFHLRTGFKINKKIPLKINHINSNEYNYQIDEFIEKPDLFLVEIKMHKKDIIL